MKYFKLLDPQHEGIIVRADGPSQQQYILDRGWVESGILMRYFNDDDELYDRYVEVSEDEAHAAIG